MKLKRFTRRVFAPVLALILGLSVTLMAPVGMDANSSPWDENETEMDFFEPETPEDPDLGDENETPEDIFTEPVMPEDPDLRDENEMPEDIFEPETPEDAVKPGTPEPEAPLYPITPVIPIRPFLPTRPVFPSLPEYPISPPILPELPLEKNENEQYGLGSLLGSIHNPLPDHLTLELWVEGAEAPAYTITATSGSFAFTDVEPGTYILKISGQKYAGREFTITTTEEALELLDALQLNLKGDLNGDGDVNVIDVARVYSHICGVVSITDDYIQSCAKVTEGEAIDIADVARLYAHVKGTKPLW